MKEFLETAMLNPLEALGQSMFTFMANVLALVIMLATGWLVAWVTGYAVERLMRVVGLDHFGNRMGLNAALARGGVKADPSHLMGRATYWVVLVFATLAGLSALSLPPISPFAQSVLAYTPRLLTAALILVAGYLLSNFISQAVLIAAVNAGLPPARIVAMFSRWGFQFLAAAMAFEQLGIAQDIVVMGFGITLGGVVLALAIAFGLGAQDLAREFLEGWFSNKPRNGAPDDLRHV